MAHAAARQYKTCGIYIAELFILVLLNINIATKRLNHDLVVSSRYLPWWCACRARGAI